MKYILTILVLSACLNGCKENSGNNIPYKNAFISGTDTAIVDEMGNVDVTKCRASSGHDDTLNHVFYIKFTNSFKKDTIYIERFNMDRVKGDVIDGKKIVVNSYNQSGGITAEKIINEKP